MGVGGTLLWRCLFGLFRWDIFDGDYGGRYVSGVVISADWILVRCFENLSC